MITSTSLLKKILITFSLIAMLSVEMLTAQNMVPNGSFEQYYECPEYARTNDKNIKLVPGWTWPTLNGTSDYFNTCNRSGQVGVPTNDMGKAPAKRGDGYAGLIVMNRLERKSDYREYLQTHLSKPMEKGKIYCVSMYYRFAERSGFSVDMLGIHFANAQVNVNSDKKLGLEPQIETPVDVFLDNYKEWTPLYTLYEATGGEEFMIIGNFRGDSETGIQENTSGQASGEAKDYSYYYIDSVQVVELNWKCEPCLCIAQDLSITVEEGTCFNGGKDLVANYKGGTEPFHNFHWENGSTDMKLTYAMTGKHTATITDDWGCKKSASVSFDCGQPLSAKFGQCEYSAGTNGYINVIVSGGIKPYKFQWSNGATTQNLKDLAPGTYKYNLTDAQGVKWTDSLTFKVLDFYVTVEKDYSEAADSGYIHLTPHGGIQPYSYLWANNDTSRNRNNLQAGLYKFTVKDSEDRSYIDSVRFVAPIEVTVESNYTFEEDGLIDISVTAGGCPPFTYKWSNGQTGAHLKFLDNGDYSYTITGSCGKVAKGTVKIQGKMVLNDVRFQSGSAKLLDSSFPELDRIVTYMTRKGNVRVEISGHTDDVGSDAINQRLSEKRAKSVVDYIASKGIDIARLEFIGRGETMPVVPNDTKEGRDQNRRVEFNIIQ